MVSKYLVVVIIVYCLPLTLLFATTTSLLENIVWWPSKFTSRIVFLFTTFSFTTLIQASTISVDFCSTLWLGRLDCLLQHSQREHFVTKAGWCHSSISKFSLHSNSKGYIAHEAFSDLQSSPVSNSSKFLPQDICTCLSFLLLGGENAELNLELAWSNHLVMHSFKFQLLDYLWELLCWSSVPSSPPSPPQVILEKFRKMI